MLYSRSFMTRKKYFADEVKRLYYEGKTVYEIYKTLNQKRLTMRMIAEEIIKQTIVVEDANTIIIESIMNFNLRTL